MTRLLFHVLVIGAAVLPLSSAAPPVQTPATRRMVEYLAALALDGDAAIVRRMPQPELYEYSHTALSPAAAEFVERVQAAYAELASGRSVAAASQLAALERAAADRAVATPEFQRLITRLHGAACLRAAEDARTASATDADRCVLFARPGTSDRTPTGFYKEAADVYAALLAGHPDDLASRWLLNVAAWQGGHSPDDVPVRWRIPESAFRSEYPLARFREVGEILGGGVSGRAGGVVLDDIDGDGLIDVLVSSVGLDASRNQLRYFHNEGRLRFTDRTVEAGLTGLSGGINLVTGDYDNDGRVDVFVPRGAWLGDAGRQPSSLLHNLGGRFEDVSEASGAVTLAPATTAAWADFDGDGWLDLYVGTETTPFDSVSPSQLLRNNRDGTFTDVAASAGVDAVGWIKGACWGDYDNDGWPDLYVARLFDTNLLFHNERGTGRARFREVSIQSGVQKPRDSYGCAFFDMDNDGWLDLLAASTSNGVFSDDLKNAAAEALGIHTAGTAPRFYRNLGNGTFADATEQVHLDRPLSTMGLNFGDIDNDGWPDLYFGTGTPMFDGLLPNRMFRNAGGRGFEDVTTAGGFGHLQKGHAIAFGDLDNDGDQDIVAVLGGVYPGDGHRRAVFENPGNANHWITLRLKGTSSNRAAIGARVSVETATPGGPRRVIHAVVSTGGSFGASSLQQEIGLGRAAGPVNVVVTWPGSNRTERYPHLAIDRPVTLTESK